MSSKSTKSTKPPFAGRGARMMECDGEIYHHERDIAFIYSQTYGKEEFKKALGYCCKCIYVGEIRYINECDIQQTLQKLRNKNK